MKPQLTWKIITPVVMVVAVVIGLTILKQKESTVTSEPLVPLPVVSVEKDTYSDSKGRFSLSYSKELGKPIESQYSNYHVTFDATYDDFIGSTFGLALTSRSETEQDYTSSQDEDSTGDYSAYISSVGWEGEKVLIANSKEGMVSCLGDSQGVYRAVLCQVKKIGDTTFLVKYSKDSYKGESTIKQYITYNKDMRYEFGGGKGLTFISYFKEYPDYNSEYQSKGYILGTVENLKKHILSRNEILVEDMLGTLVFK